MLAGLQAYLEQRQSFSIWQKCMLMADKKCFFFKVNIYVMIRIIFIKDWIRKRAGIFSFCSNIIQKMVDLNVFFFSLEKKCHFLK